MEIKIQPLQKEKREFLAMESFQDTDPILASDEAGVA